MSNWRVIEIAAAAVLTAFTTSAQAEGVGPITIAKQGHFFVGGKYYDTPQGQVIAGQAYVEFQIPENRTHPYPILMIEGCCTSGAGFNGTADGRDGWVQYFLSKGYAVYVMDQVGRGRSPMWRRSMARKIRRRPSSWSANSSRMKNTICFRRRICTRNGPVPARWAIRCSTSSR